MAQDKSGASPKEGMAAPFFDLPASNGGQVGLAALKGKVAVLFFYPKDDTPGCTREGLDFTALAPRFKKAGIEVLGISRDNLKRHAKFIEKHKLRVNLLADEEGAMCQAYGVWVQKSMYGRKYMGIERSTFLLDKQSLIAQVWRKVKVPGHAEEVLQAAQALAQA